MHFIKTFWFLILIGIYCSACSQVSQIPISTTRIGFSVTKTNETVPEVAKISIHTIQGVGHISPWQGRKVENVSGIVTAKKTDGFYMQEPNPDSNPDTSEGILVVTGFVPGVLPGDEVAVTGVVAEWVPGSGYTGNLSITILNATNFRVITSGNLLPTAIIIGKGGRIPPSEIIEKNGMHIFDPQSEGIDFYESMESMLIQVNDARVVGPSTTYKEIAVVADNGENATGLSSRGALTVTNSDWNPERIILDDVFRTLPSVTIGDRFTQPVVGILDYSFGNYKIQPIERLKFSAGGLLPESVRRQTAGELAVVTYNIDNFSAIADPTRVNKLGRQIAENLQSPDLICLEEVEDNNGIYDNRTVDASKTVISLLDSISAAGGAKYTYVDIAPENNRDGGETGGNIRVGFLYRTDRGLNFISRKGGTATSPTTLIGSGSETSLSFSPGRIDPQNPVFIDSRKPLVGEFQFQGEKIFIIGLHLNSKAGDSPLMGTVQPPSQMSQLQRIEQVQVISKFVGDLLRGDPNGKIIVLGDFNDFQFSQSLEVLHASGLEDLIKRLRLNEQYSYNFDGNAQVLDHIMLSSALSPFVVDFQPVHINSEFPAVGRVSDHDPLMVHIKIR